MNVCSLRSCKSGPDAVIKENSGNDLHEARLKVLVAACKIQGDTERKDLQLCTECYKKHNECDLCTKSLKKNKSKANKLKPVGDQALLIECEDQRPDWCWASSNLDRESSTSFWRVP
jgi:hypothetical protein